MRPHETRRHRADLRRRVLHYTSRVSRSTRRTGHSLEAILVFAKNVHVQRGVVETRKRWWRLAAACTSAPASATSCSTIRPTWNTWKSFHRRISRPWMWRRCARLPTRRPGSDRLRVGNWLPTRSELGIQLVDLVRLLPGLGHP